MPITVRCACGKRYPVKDEFAGHKVQCPDCGQVLTVPVPRGHAGVKTARRAAAAAPQALEEFMIDDPSTPAAPRKRRRGGRVLMWLLGCGCVTVLGATFLVVAAAGALFYRFSPDEIFSGDFIAQLIPPPDDGPKPDDNVRKPDDKDKKPDDKDKHSDNKDRKPDDKKPDDKKPDDKDPMPPDPPSGPWKGHTSGVVAVGFALDGRVISAGGLERRSEGIEPAPDHTIRFWNADGKEVRRIDAFKEGILAAALSPDGRYAAVTAAARLKDGPGDKGPDYAIHIWDLPQNREVGTLTGHTRDVYCLAFSRNGGKLLSGSLDHTVRLWDVPNKKEIHKLLGHLNGITSVAFSPDGTLGVSTSADQTVRLWDLDPEEGKQIREFKGHQDIVWAAAFSPDGTQLLTAGGGKPKEGGGFTEGKKDYDIRLWNVADATEVKRFKGHDKPVYALAFSRDGRRVLSAGADKTVRLWYVASGGELAKFEGHSDAVRAVAFFPDGRRALSGGDDKTLHVWDLPPDIPDLLKNLDDKDPKLRQEAVRALAKFGAEAKPAIPRLVKCLGPGDPVFRREALTLLKQLGPPERADASALVPLVNDKTFPEGRVYALDQLAALGPDAKIALPELAVLLKEQDVALRRKAIVLMGLIGPDALKTAYAPLVEFLRDSDVETSKAAGEALVKLGKPTKEQVKPLSQFLEDRNDAVRKYALVALAEMGPDALETVPQIRGMAEKDRIPELRRLALAALLKLAPKEKQSVEVFTAALKDADGGVARQAAAALAEVGPDGGALPGLLKGLESKNDAVRKTAEEAFDKATFDKAHAKTLATALVLNKDPGMRLRLIAALGRMGPDAAAAVDDLAFVLRGGDAALRLKAIAALTAIGPAAKKAAPALAELLGDKNEKSDAVRLEASVALATLGADEVKLAVPTLVKGLRMTDLNDEAQLARQKKCGEILAKIGKPAVTPLAATLEGEFFFSNVSSPEGKSKANARLAVIQTLVAIGKKGGADAALLPLARVQKSDPDPEVRKAAGEAHSKVQ